MPIEVQHQVNPYYAGVAAYGSGVADFQKQERRLQEQRDFQRQGQLTDIEASRQQQLRSIQASQLQQFQQQQYQAYAQQQQIEANERMAMFEQQSAMERAAAQSYFDSQQLVQTQQARQQQVQFEFTEGQRQQLAQLNEQRARVDQELASGNLTQYQADQVIQELDAKYLGIKKMPQEANPWAPGTEPGNVFFVRNQQDANLYGVAPVIDPVTKQALPLQRIVDPKTGKAEIQVVRGYPAGQAAVDKTEDIKIQREQAQAKIDLDRQQAQSSLDLEKQKAQATVEANRIKARGDFIVDLMTKARPTGEMDEMGKPKQSPMFTNIQEAQAYADQVFGPGPTVAPQQGFVFDLPGQQAAAQQAPGAAPIDASQAPPVTLNPDGSASLDQTVLQPESWQAAVQSGKLAPEMADYLQRTFTGVAQAYSGLGYQNGLDAISTMAWFYQRFGEQPLQTIQAPPQRDLFTEADRVFRMSGISADQMTGEVREITVKPLSLLDLKAIRPGATYLDPKTGETRVKSPDKSVPKVPMAAPPSRPIQAQAAPPDAYQWPSLPTASR